METEKELEGLKREMLKLADHFEDHSEELEDCMDADTVVGVLKSLLNGATAETIIEGYGLEVEEEAGV